MRINRTLLEIIVSSVVKELITEKMVDIRDYQQFEEKVFSVMLEDLTIEDRLDEEARNIMEQYSEMIKSSNVEYYEMFKTIKKKLIRERKLIL